MQKTKDAIVEEAFIHMKNVEDAIAENAKGILQSTMKEEISQLVKESLSEQEEEEIDVDATVSPEDESGEMDADKLDMDLDSNEMGAEDSDEMDFDSEDMGMAAPEIEEPIDLTDASDEEILRVFKAMGEDDGIIIKKDGEDIHLKDNDADVEYLVKLGESKQRKIFENMEEQEMDDNDEATQNVIDAIFGESEDMNEDDSEVMYEIEFDESEDIEESDLDEAEDDESVEMDESEDDESVEMDESEYEESDLDEAENDESVEMDESDWENSIDEAYSHKKAKKSIKPKGVGIGSGPKFKYNTSAKGGFKEDKKQGPKSVGTGKAKFEYKKGANMEGKSKVVKKAETKEAARTLGMGSAFRKGGLPKPRAHSKVNNSIKENLELEVKLLRNKNEEYRKALNVFREKLNEVAVFNSNLAYATRLFTEHSTTKKEKINILRRFDDVDSLKESKTLYKSIKEELSKSESKTINESVEKKINNTPSSGSAVSLIESKTYENEQFLRIKDLMKKLK